MKRSSCVLGAVLAVACAPAREAPPPAPPPALPAPAPVESPRIAPLLPPGADTAYTLELVTKPFPFVEVTLATHGQTSGTTHLKLNEWGGVEHPENEVHGLVVTGADGQPRAIEHARGAVWTVHHAPGELLRARYALVSTQYDVGNDSESYYRPLLTPTFFHAIGNTSLLYVDDLPDEQTQRISLVWRGFKEAGWKVSSSFGVEPEGTSVNTRLDEFRQAVFFAGDIRLLRRDIHGSPLWIAIAGTDWGFTDEAFADSAAKVVLAQRAFFGDYDWPFFFISVIPIGHYSPGATSQGGTGLTHSFSVFLTPKTGLALDADDGRGVTWLLSHELFHLWNGHRYRQEEPEALGYWFSEGFTDYYARRLLRRAGLADTRGFVANLNDLLVRYTLSPVKNEPATRIAADFWKNQAVEKLPYLRGDVVALLVDAEIRKSSHGGKSLDDLMKDLLGSKVEPPPKVNGATFLAKIEAYTSPAFAESIRKVVVDGASASVPVSLLEPCLHGHVASMGPFEPGFDEAAARSKHVVSGVSPGGGAYRAGLRNGQRVASFTMRRGNPLASVSVVVDDRGATRTITFLPQGKAVPVVQFAAGGALPAACEDLL